MKLTELNVMFAGASGTGKTTLAKYISTEMGLSFVSGSVSDLLPDTASIPHKDMLSRDSKTLAMEDFQILNLRNKLFQSYIDDSTHFVSDRSYLDSAAYFLYKQADKLPQCEVENFLDLCLMCLTKQCSHLILIPFTTMMFEGWVTEDNGKRITSKYFQMEISRIMEMILDIWGFQRKGRLNSISNGIFNQRVYEHGLQYGQIKTPYGTTQVIILDEVNITNRENLLNYVLKK